MVNDFGGKQVLKVDPLTGASSVFISIPGEKIGPNAPRTAWSAPNGMTFDKKGNIYIADSFQGTVWRTGPTGGAALPWVKSDLLISHGYPLLGANGLTFDRTGTVLFIANTGDDTIVRVPVVNGEAGKPEVFMNGVNGPDGMFVDEEHHGGNGVDVIVDNTMDREHIVSWFTRHIPKGNKKGREIVSLPVASSSLWGGTLPRDRVDYFFAGAGASLTSSFFSTVFDFTPPSSFTSSFFSVFFLVFGPRRK